MSTGEKLATGFLFAAALLIPFTMFAELIWLFIRRGK